MSAETSEQLEKVRAFLDELDAHETEQIVVRWVDETRPFAAPEEGRDDQSGYTVGRVARATFTAKRGDELVQQTFEDVGYDELKKLVAQYPFETLYRSDNVTR